MSVTIKTTPPAHPGTAAPPPASARIDGLDGIRALGVIAVVLYHTDLSWSPAAGFLGVDVFFTLSGFLITALLLREYRATHRIDLRQFYLRRARRLLPAMWLLLLLATAAGLLVSHDTIEGLRGDVPAAFLYVSNWWQIYHGQSYFELIGRPAPLQHLWSLSIEEQFYIVWPALLIYLLARGRVQLLARESLATPSSRWPSAWRSPAPSPRGCGSSPPGTATRPTPTRAAATSGSTLIRWDCSLARRSPRTGTPGSHGQARHGP